MEPDAPRRVLAADEVLLLSDLCVRELRDLEQRIAQQRAVARDGSTSHRWRSKRLLRSLQDRAAEFSAALEQLRAGGPRCRQCLEPLPYALLLVRPLAAECGSCPPWQDAPYDELAARRGR